jgi:hypothetical protein
MAKKEEKKPVAAQSTAVTPPGYDFSGDAGAGFENVRPDDLSIPFLVILQDGSPEVKKTHPDYATKGIKGAVAGHIMNSLTKQIYNPNVDTDKVTFIPCFYQKLWVEWKDRQKGAGGIVKSHPDDRLLGNTRKNDKGQDVLPNGNILNTTAYFFGMVIVDDEPIRCVIGLTSTQLKKARQWLSMATSIKFDGPQGKFTPPLFAHRYNLSAVPENIEEARTIQQQSRAGAMKLNPADPAEAEHTEEGIPGQ